MTTTHRIIVVLIIKMTNYLRSNRRNKKEFSVSPTICSKCIRQYLQRTRFGTPWTARGWFGCSFHTVVGIWSLYQSTFQPDTGVFRSWSQHVHILKLDIHVNQSVEYLYLLKHCSVRYKLHLPTVSRLSKKTFFHRLWVRNLSISDSITAGLRLLRLHLWRITADWLTAVCQLVDHPRLLPFL